MGFLNTDSMPRLVEKLSDGDNIKITGNSKGNRVGTVVKKIVEKADDVTKAIEQEVVNDSYSFKVGTGDVDVSADVEDGFGEVGVKGVTYQNLITNPSRIIRTIDQTGIKYKHFYALGKQNTVYTVILDVYKNTTTSDASNWGIYIDGANYSQDTFIGNTSIGLTKAGFVGRHISKITSNENTSCTRFSIGMHSDYGSSYEFEADVVLLEGDHTNNPNLPSYFKNIVGVGDKSKNLFNIKDFVEFAKDTTESPFYYPITLEANTQYTFSDSTGMWNGCGFFLELLTDEKEKLFNLIDSNLANRNKFTFTTNAKTQYLLKLYKHNVDKMLSLSTNFQLEKGSTATTYEPYYDGHKIEILSNGKNLWNGKMYSGWGGASPTMDELGCRDNVITDFIRVARNKNCFINKAGFAYAWLYDLNKNLIDAYHGNINAFDNGVATKNADYIILGRSLGSSQINKEEYMDTIISYNKNDSFIESKSDKTQILLDEPLMRLDTSKDEITRDGKLIKRLCLTEVDGTEEWSRFYPNTIEEESIVFVTRLNKDSYINCVQDYRLKSTFAPANETNTILSKEAVQIYDSKLRVKLLKSRLTSLDVVGFKKWLSSNPIQILYLLKEPIIIDIVPPTLRIFKDGHLTFNTLVAPESNHVVQLNKSAQIERSIREVQGLDSRVGQLESFYDDMMLETNHKLSLLNYDFEYTRERNGE